MKREEFMQKTGISHFDGVYYFVYREKTVLQYMEEVKKEGVEPKLDEDCVKYFKDIDLDIADGFNVNIMFLGRLGENNKPIYSIHIRNKDGVWFNMLFDFELNGDDEIDLIINSLCKAMYLKCYRTANVRFVILWNKDTFEEYFKEYMEEVE